MSSAQCERLLQCIHKAHSKAVERVSAESKLREEVSACRRKLAYTEGAWMAAISALESTESLLGDARGRLLACGVVPGVCLAGQREADKDGGSKPGAKKGAGGLEEKAKGLQRQLDMMMRQRQGEQQAMILHMRCVPAVAPRMHVPVPRFGCNFWRLRPGNRSKQVDTECGCFRLISRGRRSTFSIRYPKP